MAETILGGVIDFFTKLGVYDVVLPFILVFTIVFAILEKTRVFGVEGKEKYTRKNLNAMTAFVVAFLVIASSKLVETITAVSSQIVILLLLVVFFLMLVGTFYSEETLEKGTTLSKAWNTAFMWIMFLGTTFIFLNAIKTADGTSWLEIFIGVLLASATDVGIAAIVLLILIALFVWWVVKAPKEKKEEEGEK